MKYYIHTSAKSTFHPLLFHTLSIPLVFEKKIYFFKFYFEIFLAFGPSALKLLVSLPCLLF